MAVVCCSIVCCCHCMSCCSCCWLLLQLSMQPLHVLLQLLLLGLFRLSACGVGHCYCRWSLRLLLFMCCGHWHLLLISIHEVAIACASCCYGCCRSGGACAACFAAVCMCCLQLHILLLALRALLSFTFMLQLLLHVLLYFCCHCRCIPSVVTFFGCCCIFCCCHCMSCCKRCRPLLHTLMQPLHVLLQLLLLVLLCCNLHVMLLAAAYAVLCNCCSFCVAPIGIC